MMNNSNNAETPVYDVFMAPFMALANFNARYQLAPDGTLARIFLAFLTTAGLFYVNIMPALVDGLTEALGFSNQQAGYVGSANMYGAAFGALTAVFIVKRISWKPVALGLLLTLIPESKDVTDSATKSSAAGSGILVKPMVLTLIAIFLFQASNMGPYAFIVGLGEYYGMTREFISPSMGAAAWIGIVGSLLVVFLSTRFGRTLPVVGGALLTLIATAALVYSGQSKWIYVIANCAVGITWAFVIAYLLGMAAEFDRAGQMAALGGFASKMGLASGPMICGWVGGRSLRSYADSGGGRAIAVCYNSHLPGPYSGPTK